MKIFVAVLVIPLFLWGCAGMMPVEKNVKKTFTYDYRVE